MYKRIKRRGLLVALLVLGGLAAGVGIAAAVIPSSDGGTISACYQRQSGVLRVIDAEGGATCMPNENRVSWSSGGAAGLSGVEMITVDVPIGTFDGTASCPAGKVALNGGIHSISYDETETPRYGEPTVYHFPGAASPGGMPAGGNPPTAWYAGVGQLPADWSNPGGSAIFVQTAGGAVWVLCATAAP